MDIAGCHPDDLRYYPISSWRCKVIWTLSNPDELDPGRISSGWVTVNSLCHPDDMPYHLMSSGWLNWSWFFIRMSYGNVIISSGWDTLPFLSHPGETANFDFPQYAVALQHFRMISCYLASVLRTPARHYDQGKLTWHKCCSACLSAPFQ